MHYNYILLERIFRIIHVRKSFLLKNYSVLISLIFFSDTCHQLFRTRANACFPRDLVNHLSLHYTRNSNHARPRDNSRNRKRKLDLKYFRQSRFNFRSGDELLESQGLSYYGRNNPQKNLELLKSLPSSSPPPSPLSLFSPRDR